MFDGVAGTTAVTLTANRTAAAAPIADLAVEAEREEERPAGEQLKRPGAELGDGRDRAPARLPEDAAGRCGPASALADRASDAGDPALAVGRDQRGASSTTTSSSSGASETRKTFSVLDWKRSVVLTMIPPSIDQGDDVERRLGDDGADQHRERLAHAADPAGEDHRPGGLAEAGRQGRRHQHPDHRRRGDVAAADGRPGSAARTIAVQEAARTNSEATIRAQATATQVTSEPTMLSATLSTPIFRAARAVSPMPSTAGDAEADPARGAAAAPPAGARVEARRGAWRAAGAAVEPDQPEAAGDGLGLADRGRHGPHRALVDLGDLVGDPGQA